PRRGRRTAAHGGVRMTTDERDAEPDVSLVAALPGLARIGAVASVRLIEWTAGAYLRAGSRIIRAAANGEAAGEVLQRTGEDLLAYLRNLLVVTTDPEVAEDPMAEPEPQPQSHP